MMIASTRERLTSNLTVLFLVLSCLVCNSCLYGAVLYDSIIIMNCCAFHRPQVYGGLRGELPAVLLLQPPAHLTVSKGTNIALLLVGRNCIGHI